MKEKKQTKRTKVKLITEDWQKQDKIHSDTLGSYTGTSTDFDNKPEQDADDL